jgi:uncharacterized protein (TIRG00374 family)
MRHVLTALRVIVPLGLLIYIFSRVDTKALLDAFKTVEIKYVIISVLFANIAQVFGGAIRWYYLVREENRSKNPLKYIRIYWLSMFYGYFVPSNVGMDVYRVAVVGKEKRNYEQHIATLVGEKFYTLFFSLMVLFVSQIVVYQKIKGSEVAYALDVLAVIFIAAGVISTLLFLFCKRQFSDATAFLKNKFYHYLDAVAGKLSSKIPFNVSNFRAELQGTVKKEFFTKSLVFTVLLKLSLAVGGFFLFLALGYELPFWYLLFANSVFFVLFLLPISFGSLGVREGAYILVYGLFGINAETALAASFIALAGLVFTISIGGIISLTENFKKISINYGK